MVDLEKFNETTYLKKKKKMQITDITDADCMHMQKQFVKTFKLKI